MMPPHPRTAKLPPRNWKHAPTAKHHLVAVKRVRKHGKPIVTKEVAN
jgi:hypothetical protein